MYCTISPRTTCAEASLSRPHAVPAPCSLPANHARIPVLPIFFATSTVPSTASVSASSAMSSMTKISREPSEGDNEVRLVLTVGGRAASVRGSANVREAGWEQGQRNRSAEADARIGGRAETHWRPLRRESLR